MTDPEPTLRENILREWRKLPTTMFYYAIAILVIAAIFAALDLLSRAKP